MCAVLQQEEMSSLLPIPLRKLPKREGLLSTHRGGYRLRRPHSTEGRSPEAQPAAIASRPCLRELCAWESGHHSALLWPWAHHSRVSCFPHMPKEPNHGASTVSGLCPALDKWWLFCPSV